MKKEKIKKIELNIPNRVFYFLTAIILLISVGAGVYAWGGITPATLGHTMAEIRPPCSGILSSSGTDNSWNCIGTPVSCIGSNQVLQYSASSKTWSCATIITGPECDWTGWEEICFYPNWCQFDFSSDVETQCDNDPAQFVENSRYCAGGFITQTKSVECCPNHGGGVCTQPLA